jgi:hypothetical protein
MGDMVDVKSTNMRVDKLHCGFAPAQLARHQVKFLVIPRLSFDKFPGRVCAIRSADRDDNR